MDVVTMSREDEDLFICCLEDWSDEMKEQGCHRKCWYEKMKNGDSGSKLPGTIQVFPEE